MTSKPSKFVQCWALDGKGGARRVEDESVNDPLPPGQTLWVHFDIGDADACRWVQHDAKLPDYAVDSLLADETRPRSAIFADGLLIVLRGVNLNPGADPEDMVAIRVWIERNRIISSRRRRLLSIQDIADSFTEGTGPAGPSDFLPMLIECLADRIGTFVDAIDARLDDIEDVSARGDITSHRVQLSALRRQIAEVRRFLAPQRDALDRLTRQSSPWLEEPDVMALRQEADRVTRYLEDLDLGRERAIVMQEELLGRIAQEQNSRMYVLSVVAAVFLPLTFITGLLGMNVGGLPGLDTDAGFLWSVVVMLVAGAGLLTFFRWKRWL